MDYNINLNWPDFIERYWQKRPVVLKRGFAQFIDPISLTNWPVWPWKMKSTAAW
jgi:ribosomal protein L16 Arg81 hydroxylase